MAFILGILVGLATGWGLGGRLIHLAEIRWNALPLLLAGPGLQFALPLLWPHIARHPALEVARAGVLYAAAIGFLMANRRLPGVWPALAGAACNGATTLAAGGRMPVALAALRRFPARAAATMAAGGFGAHAPMAHPAGLFWLGDVIASPPPLPPEVLSVGDILIGIAIAVFLARGMLPRLPSAAGAPAKSGLPRPSAPRER